MRAVGTAIDLRAIWLTARPRLRAQWASLFALALIAGLVGASVLAAGAASRRAGTSFDRLMDAAASATVEAEVFEEVDPSVIEQIGGLDGVEGASLVAFVALIPQGIGLPFADGITFANLVDAGTSAFDGLIVEGRALDPAADDEVLLNPAMADELGLGVGDRIELDGLTPEDAERVLEGDVEVDTFSVSATVVGITRGAEDVADPSDPYTIASSTLASSSGAAVYPGLVGIRSEGTELATVIREVERLLPGTVVRPSDDLRSRIIDGIDVQAKGLVAFALVVGAVGLFAVAQAVSRTVATARGEDHVLAALGVTPRERQLAAVVHVVPVAVGGALITVAAGILLAPHAITGLAKQAEPHPGTWFDPFVTLGVSALLIVVVVSAAVRAGVPSRRPTGHQSLGITERATAARLPLFAGLGVRRAIGTDSSRWAGRAATAVAVIAVAGVTAVATFDQSIEHLFRTPDDWGAPFDVFVANGPNRAEALEEVAAGLADDPAVQSAAVVSEVSGTVRRPDGVPISAAVIHAVPAVGNLEPWTVVGGTGPQTDTDAVVGRGLLEDLGIDIGDPLEVSTDGGEHTLHVVGTVVAYGAERVDRHIIVTPEGAARLEAESEDPGIVVRLVDGADVDLEVKRLSDALYGVERLAPPAAIDNLDELGVLPTALALTVGALGIAAVAHTLSTSVSRSRREVASLRASGTTGRQLRMTVVAHAVTVGLIGVALGIPLGIALGRVTYVDTAEGVGALAHPVVPALALGALVVVTLLAVLLIATLPGYRIAHLPPAPSLREE